MDRKKELEAMSPIQLMDLLEKYKLDTNCKRSTAIERILEHEGLPTKATRPPRNQARTKLKALRIKAGFTQKELAEQAEINQGTLTLYEQGKKNFDGAKIQTIMKVCTVLGCKLEDIIEDADILEVIAEYNEATS